MDRWLLRILVPAFCVVLPQASVARTAAQISPGEFGLGIIFGEPTGIVAKLWQSRAGAFDFGLAYSFGNYLLFYSDYLHHFPGLIRAQEPFFRQLAPYVGIGTELFVSSDSSPGNGRFLSNQDSSVGLGARIPLGIEWLPPQAPIGIFFELVPGIGLIPGVFGFFQGGIGARYYF